MFPVNAYYSQVYFGLGLTCVDEFDSGMEPHSHIE